MDKNVNYYTVDLYNKEETYNLVSFFNELCSTFGNNLIYFGVGISFYSEKVDHLDLLDFIDSYDKSNLIIKKEDKDGYIDEILFSINFSKIDAYKILNFIKYFRHSYIYFLRKEKTIDDFRKEFDAFSFFKFRFSDSRYLNIINASLLCDSDHSNFKLTSLL